MCKENVTRRVRIEKYTVASDAPVTKRFKGVDVAVIPVPPASGSAANSVWIERDYERKWKAFRDTSVTIEQYGSRLSVVGGSRFSLHNRSSTPPVSSGQDLYADSSAMYTERVSGFDDVVTFHCRRNDGAACTAIIYVEITDYVPVN